MEASGPSTDHPPTRIEWRRDPSGTTFAIEVCRAPRWDETLREPPDATVADVRIVTLERGDIPRDTPAWLAVAVAATPEPVEERVLATTLTLWRHSPHFRPPGSTVESYLDAGFRALCAPHPAADFGPGSREAIVAYVRGCADPLGRLAELRSHAFERWLRISWSTPEAFGRAIMVVRMLDAGARRELQSIQHVERAAFEPDRFLLLAEERDRLAPRLDPARCFARDPDFNAAVADAEDWWHRYAAAYGAQHEDLAGRAESALAEMLPAIAAAEVLCALNGGNGETEPLGAHALAQLDAVITEMRALTQELRTIPIPGLPLGHMPAFFEEAQFAAAGVLAAVNVQRHRSSSTRTTSSATPARH